METRKYGRETKLGREGGHLIKKNPILHRPARCVRVETATPARAGVITAARRDLCCLTTRLESGDPSSPSRRLANNNRASDAFLNMRFQFMYSFVRASVEVGPKPFCLTVVSREQTAYYEMNVE